MYPGHATMSSAPSSAIEGMAAAASFGASCFFPHAASVNAALQVTSSRVLENMASPLLFGVTRGWATRFARHSKPYLRLLVRLRGALGTSPAHRRFASCHAGIVLGRGDHRERHVESRLHRPAEFRIGNDVELIGLHGFHHDLAEIHRVVTWRDHFLEALHHVGIGTVV